MTHATADIRCKGSLPSELTRGMPLTVLTHMQAGVWCKASTCQAWLPMQRPLTRDGACPRRVGAVHAPTYMLLMSCRGAILCNSWQYLTILGCLLHITACRRHRLEIISFQLQHKAIEGRPERIKIQLKITERDKRQLKEEQKGSIESKL